MSMRKTTLARGNLLRSVQIGEKLPRRGGLLIVVQRVTRLSKLPPGQQKTHVNSYRRRPCTESKLTPGSLSCPGAMSCPGIM